MREELLKLFLNSTEIDDKYVNIITHKDSLLLYNNLDNELKNISEIVINNNIILRNYKILGQSSVYKFLFWTNQKDILKNYEFVKNLKNILNINQNDINNILLILFCFIGITEHILQKKFSPGVAYGIISKILFYIFKDTKNIISSFDDDKISKYIKIMNENLGDYKENKNKILAHSYLYNNNLFDDGTKNPINYDSYSWIFANDYIECSKLIKKPKINYRKSLTINNIDLQFLKSALQKYIRRNMTRKAIWCALEWALLRCDKDAAESSVKSVITNLRNRLRIIYIEDTSIANLDLMEYINDRISVINYEKNPLGINMDRNIVDIVSNLSQSYHTRICSYVNSIYKIYQNAKFYKKQNEYISYFPNVKRVYEYIENDKNTPLEKNLYLTLINKNIACFYYAQELNFHEKEKGEFGKNNKVFPIIRKVFKELKLDLKYVDISEKWYNEIKNSEAFLMYFLPMLIICFPVKYNGSLSKFNDYTPEWKNIVMNNINNTPIEFEQYTKDMHTKEGNTLGYTKTNLKGIKHFVYQGAYVNDEYIPNDLYIELKNYYEFTKLLSVDSIENIYLQNVTENEKSGLTKTEELTTEIKLSPNDLKWFFNPKNVKGKFVDLNLLKLTKESKYSVTPWQEASFITNNIITFFNSKDITITDATANVGGNSIDFYNNEIEVVNSVEIDPKTCEFLKNNLKVYGYEINTVFCNNYVDIYKTLNQDCVFFDPPWGGPDYIKKDNLDLFLGDVNVVDIIKNLFDMGKTKLVVLKAPINYNSENLQAIFTPELYKITEEPIFRGKKHSYDVFFISKYINNEKIKKKVIIDDDDSDIEIDEEKGDEKDKDDKDKIVKNENDFFEYITRAQITTGSGKTDSYFAKMKNNYKNFKKGEIVFVKGPFKNDDVYKILELFIKVKKILNIPYLEVDKIDLQLSDTFFTDEVHSLLHTNPHYIRTKLNKKGLYTFIIYKNLCGDNIYKIKYGDIKTQKSQIWIDSNVWISDWKKLNEDGLCKEFNLTSLKNTKYLCEYILSIYFRYLFGINDHANRNFVISEDNLYSVDEENIDMDNSSNFSKLDKQFEFIKANWNKCNEYILQTLKNWILQLSELEDVIPKKYFQKFQERLKFISNDPKRIFES